MLRLTRATRATRAVLAVLVEVDKPVWGLQIIKRTSSGPGTVYPVLERLERQGWLASEWEPASERRGPRRRLYRLTPEGAVAARETIRHAEPAAPARRSSREGIA